MSSAMFIHRHHTTPSHIHSPGQSWMPECDRCAHWTAAKAGLPGYPLDRLIPSNKRRVCQKWPGKLFTNPCCKNGGTAAMEACLDFCGPCCSTRSNRQTLKHLWSTLHALLLWVQRLSSYFGTRFYTNAILKPHKMSFCASVAMCRSSPKPTSTWMSTCWPTWFHVNLCCTSLRNNVCPRIIPGFLEDNSTRCFWGLDFPHTDAAVGMSTIA